MKWISIKKVIGFGTLFCVFCPFFLSSSSFALSKSITYSYDNPTSYNQDVFPDCLDSTCLSDYSYLLVEYSTSSDINNQIMLTQSTGSSISLGSQWGRRQQYFSRGTPYTIFLLGSSSYPPTYLRFYDNIFQNITTFQPTVTFTLLDSLPSADCPVCEECEICPVIPENPYDNKLDNITMAIYVCAGTALVIYFFYCIYRIIIKGVNK